MKLAAQTIVFGDDFASRLRQNLSIVQQAEFDAVEVGPCVLEDTVRAELREVMDDTGLHVSAVHAGIRVLHDADEFKRVCERMQLIGCAHLICSGIISGGSTRSYYERTGDLLAAHTEQAEACGIQLSYHHHDWELRRIFGDRPGLHVLLDNVHERTGLVIDTFWAEVANVQLAMLWESFGDRCRIVHLKDGDKNRVTFSPLGEGTCDVVRAHKFLYGKGLEYLVWEQDRALHLEIPKSVRISAEWLRRQAAERENEITESEAP